jgi:hypothetical protein
MSWLPPALAGVLPQTKEGTGGGGGGSRKSHDQNPFRKGQGACGIISQQYQQRRLQRQNSVTVNTFPRYSLRHRLPFPAMRFVRRNGQTQQGTTSRACAWLCP